MELLEEVKENVTKILNKIAILEFKYNSLLGEYKRIPNYYKIREDSKFKELYKELEETIKPYIKNYEYKISEMGSLQILEETEKLGDASVYTQKLWLQYDIDLPYGYVMGKPCGKRVSNEILNKYSYLLG